MKVCVGGFTEVLSISTYYTEREYAMRPSSIDTIYERLWDWPFGMALTRRRKTDTCGA